MGYDREHYDAWNTSPIQIGLAGIALCLLLFSFSVLCVIVFSLCRHTHKKKKRSMSMFMSGQSRSCVECVDFPTITAATFYFLSCFPFMAALYHFDPNDANNFGNDAQFTVSAISFVACVFVAKLSIYSQFVARLHSAFKDSYLASKRRTFVVSIMLLVLLSISIAWWMALISLRYIWWKQTFWEYDIQFFFVFGSMFVFDASVSWLVVGLFLHKLFDSLMLRSRSDFIDSSKRMLFDTDAKDDEYDIDERLSSRQLSRSVSLQTDIAFASIDESDEKRLNLITRLSLLSILRYVLLFGNEDDYECACNFSMVTNQLGYVTLIVLLVLKETKTGGYNDYTQTVLYSIFGGVFYPLDMVLNCLVLYFSYTFAVKYYLRCCRCCHHRCKLCVVTRAANRIRDKYMAMDNDHYSRL